MENLLTRLNREKNSHKGENGKVAIIGGSIDYAGAPAIAAKAAYRSGADLVKIFTSEKVEDTISSYSENFIVSSYNGDYLSATDVNEALELLNWCDAAIIGPGLSQPDNEAIKQIISRTDKPVVVDADAINPAVDINAENTVFTPHRGEKEYIESEYSSVSNFVSENQVAVVKGEEDKIYNSERSYSNTTGCESMTVGGTGDMLTGVIAALLAQNLSLTDASRLGVWANGKAGELSSDDYGYGALPTDMIEKLPQVLFDAK